MYIDCQQFYLHSILIFNQNEVVFGSSFMIMYFSKSSQSKTYCVMYLQYDQKWPDGI